MAGMNWEIEADPDPEGDRRRQSEQAEDHPVERAGDDGEDHAGGDVATGLGDGELPDPEDLVLARRGKERADALAQPGTIGREVVREDGDGQHLEQDIGDRRAEAEKVTGEIAGEPRSLAAGLELAEQVVGADLDAEGGVEPPLCALDIGREVVDELIQLVGDERAHHGEEHHDRRHHAEQSDDRGNASAHATVFELVDHRFDGEGQEQRHHDLGEQTLQFSHQYERENDGGAGEPPDDDRPPQPRWWLASDSTRGFDARHLRDGSDCWQPRRREECWASVQRIPAPTGAGAGFGGDLGFRSRPHQSGAANRATI